MKGLGTFFLRALSKLAGRNRSYDSSFAVKSILVPPSSSAGSSSAPFPFFLALALAFLAASIA
jgi:hypothetical protein